MVGNCRNLVFAPLIGIVHHKHIIVIYDYCLFCNKRLLGCVKAVPNDFVGINIFAVTALFRQIKCNGNFKLSVLVNVRTDDLR